MRLSNAVLDQIKNNAGKNNVLVVKKNNKLDKITIKKSVSAFQLNITLIKLDLSYTSLDDSAVYTLANLLVFPNTFLEHLILEGNVITDNGALKLADALKINHTLKELNIANNDIGDAGGCGLAQALIHNHSLKILNIFGNDEIGTRTLFALAEALPKSIVKTLILDGLDDAPPEDNTSAEKNFSTDGLKALVRAVKENYTLTDLKLADTFDDTTYQDIFPFLNRNAKMEELSNHFHEAPIIIYKNFFLKNNLPMQFPTLFLLALSTMIKEFKNGKINFTGINSLSPEILKKFTPHFMQFLLSVMAKYDQKDENDKNSTTNTNVIHYNEEPNKFWCKKRKKETQSDYAIKFSPTTTLSPHDHQEHENEGPQKKQKTSFELCMRINPLVFKRGDKEEKPVPVTPFYLFK